ncbi:MAG TPA: polysaccharide lyase family protein, partial [Phycisphaerae bacterium]|nr:polysaccharide lyase family protein [Phycisphaerae bacterium]
TYTETLYLDQLAVGTRVVTISSSQTTTADIVNSLYTPPAASTVFRIGTWDGTPLGFLNADKIEIMHPSDVRMASWTSTPNFVVGTNTDDQWPMIQFMGVNNSQRITFNLTAAQVQNLTLRIGITLGFEGGRNKVTVNAGQSYQWVSTNPSASTDLNSRGITRGTWRGNNQLYQYSIPASALRAGTNTIDLPVISGSFVAGATWLSPNVVYDAIDLVYTSAATPSLSSVTLAPANPILTVGTSTLFSATARNSSGTIVPANFNFSSTIGAINPAGTFTAPTSPTTGTLTAVATITRTPGYTVTSSSSTSFNNALTASGSTIITVVNATVTARQLFYANSIFDTTHDNAIATDKSPLFPGQTATLANYSSYSRGINGIMIDISRLAAPLTLADFTFRVGNDNNPANWSAAPAPLSVTTRTLTGTTSRIEILFPDNAIKGQWLQVTLKGGSPPTGSNSGLAADDTFYFGNAPGEVGDDPAHARVDATDQLTIRYGAGMPAPITATRDINRDGIIDNADEQVARANATWSLTELRLITPPVTASSAAAQPPAPALLSAAIPTGIALSPTTTISLPKIEPTFQPIPLHPRPLTAIKNILIKIRRKP